MEFWYSFKHNLQLNKIHSQQNFLNEIHHINQILDIPWYSWVILKSTIDHEHIEQLGVLVGSLVRRLRVDASPYCIPDPIRSGSSSAEKSVLNNVLQRSAGQWPMIGFERSGDSNTGILFAVTWFNLC